MDEEAERKGADARGALAGLLVVAVEQAVAAPLCTARLVDAGARVIKIERPAGDFARGYDRAARGESSYFVWTNHAKESIALDLKDEEGAALLHRILARADVFVHNLAPGALARAGFADATLRDRHPRLITCEISGYGDSQALRGMKAYDLLVQAESGLASISGSPEAPGRVGVSLCDIGAGVTAHAAILEALIGRGIDGCGRGLSVSLFDVAAEWMTVPLVHAETGDGPPARVGLKHPSIAPYGAFPDAEGVLTLIAIQNEREWSRLCVDVFGEPALASDARFRDNVLRVEHREALDAAIVAITERMSTPALRAALAAASIAWGALNGVHDLGRHAALRRRPVDTGGGRDVSLPAHPVRVAPAVSTTASGSTATDDRAEMPPRTSPRVPRLDEHGAAIRAEFSDAELRACHHRAEDAVEEQDH